MRRVALKVAYIGTEYHGFQRQPNLETVEEKLIEALKSANLINDLKKAEYSIAGRTDKGVNALGNIISFITDESVIINQINNFLPKDIRILAKTDVPMGFKPRYAKNRHYRYLIVNCFHLNLVKMIDASKIFKGTHNFRNFSKRDEKNPVRTINDIKISNKNNVVMVDVIGESFLWNMVRKMVKVLIMIGKDELRIEELDELFDPKIEANIVPMPPEGLILMDIEYNGVEFEYDEYAINKFIKVLKEEYLLNKTMAAVEDDMIMELMDY